MMQQGGFNPTSSTENLYTGMLTDDRGKEQQAGAGQGVKGMQYKIGESPAEELMHQARLAEMNRGAGLLGGPIKPYGDGQRGELDAAAAAAGWNPEPADPVVAQPPPFPDYGVPRILPPGPPVAAPEAPPLGPVDLSKIPSDIPPLVPNAPLTRTRLPLPTGQLPQERLEEFKGASLAPPIGAELTAQVTPGTGTTRTIDRRDYQDTREAPDPVVSDPRDAGDIENTLNDQQKNDLNNIKNEVNTYLNNVGWSDSGDWGYARTRNLLTGGGLGSVVTQGPMVPWQSMGGDASSADYISNVGGRDVMPSRLSEADRLKGSGGGELSYVPEGQKVDYLRQNYGTSGGGEGHTPFNEFLSSADNVDPAALNTAITNFNRLKTHEFTANTFTGVDTTKGFVETILSPIKGGIDAAENLLTFITDGLGISDSDVKDPGFFKWLNTPLDAISTSEVGIKPLDVIMIAAGGMPALGAIAVGKVMGGILKPITSRIKGTLKQLFSGDVDELSDADKNDVVNEWERIMDVEVEDTNTYNPNNKLDVITSGDYFISDPDRDAADQAKNWLLDGFESGNVLNLSGQRVAVFTDSFGNSVNVHDTNIDSRTSDIILGPNNQAYGIRSGSDGDSAYAITTTSGQPITMSEWNNGKVSGVGSGGGGGVLKTLWDWVTSKRE
jgi:hypothetical protein